MLFSCTSLCVTATCYCWSLTWEHRFSLSHHTEHPIPELLSLNHSSDLHLSQTKNAWSVLSSQFFGEQLFWFRFVVYINLNDFAFTLFGLIIFIVFLFSSWSCPSSWWKPANILDTVIALQKRQSLVCLWSTTSMIFFFISFKHCRYQSSSASKFEWSVGFSQTKSATYHILSAEMKIILDALEGNGANT